MERQPHSTLHQDENHVFPSKTICLFLSGPANQANGPTPLYTKRVCAPVSGTEATRGVNPATQPSSSGAGWPN
ncbi:hypothetical protein RDI58_012447 [Solanum bulbocastanum]|uniref:Uncharacterized protein n=1 Tax=Solanum bulbocastanum TaxID=147425 RepID=A0AAN8YD39_SOLBU